MRAQRIQDKIYRLVLFCQIFLLSTLGIGLALVAIWAVILVFTCNLLFYPSWLAYFVLSLVICLMALLGGVISLPRLLKVDPITAIAE